MNWQLNSDVISSCEKPLATTAEEAHHLHKIVEQAGVKHTYAATHRYDPSVTWTNQLITSQTIGDLKGIDVIFSFPFAKELKPWEWMNSLPHGSGMLNNGLVHLLGMLEKMTSRKFRKRVSWTQIPESG
ncbi:TPA: hypothetical protein EYM26_01375 [Candidatus Poribacteria bacterium]|nr:hypothetical protein [Candidatus Poribacteria bacterium]